MTKAHENIEWENKPSDKSPLNKRNLNKMDYSIDVIDDRVIVLDSTKATKVEVSPLIKEVAYDEQTGIITFTRKNGATFTIDTPMEKIALNIYYDPVTEMLTLPLVDGTYMEVDLSRLITEFEFVDSATIALSVSADGKVTAIVKEGSIGEQHLRPNYLADIKVEAGKAQASAASAAASEAAAAQSEQNAANSATAAAGSATVASGSASAAAASETVATQKAAAASASATAAAASQEAAADAEIAAGASATAAAGSATAADASQKAAAESQAAAAASATTASQKADDAADSATEAESYAHGGTGTRPGEDDDNAKKYYEGVKEIFEDLETAGAVFGVKGEAETEYRSGFVNLTPGNVRAFPARMLGEISTFQTFWEKVNELGSLNTAYVCAVRFKDTGGWSPKKTWWRAIVGFQNTYGGTYTAGGFVLLIAGDMHYGVVSGGSSTEPDMSVTWYKVYSELNKPTPADIGTLAYYTHDTLGIESQFITDVIAALPDNSIYHDYAKKEDPVVAAAGITDNYASLMIYKVNKWMMSVQVIPFDSHYAYHWAGNHQSQIKLAAALPTTGGELTGELVPTAGIAHAGKNAWVAYPEDGMYSITGITTGYLVITLPQSWTDTMLKFAVTIFNYEENTAVDYYISGYLYEDGNTWYNCSAVCVGKAGTRTGNLTVRFGHDGTRCVVLLGETTSVWSYLHVKIHDILPGWHNTEYSKWCSGWGIYISATTKPTITRTITNTHVGYGAMASSCTGNAATATTASNANALGGYPVQRTQGANTIPMRDAQGYTWLNYINSDTGNNENPAISQIIVTNGSDNFYRKASIAHLKAQMGLDAVNNTADSAKSVAYAASAGNADTVDGHHFNWSGQSGQPTWLWGGNDATNMYVYNPSNFSVNYAASAGSAGSATKANKVKLYPYDMTTEFTYSELTTQPIYCWCPTTPASKTHIYKISNLSISTSDRREKYDISYIGSDSEYDTFMSDEQLIELIKGIRPVVYRRNNGESKRPHHGLISQDFEELMKKIGLKDHAGFIKSPKIDEIEIEDENGEKRMEQEVIEGEYIYGFRYEELVTDIIRFCQIQQQQIEAQAEEIKELWSGLQALEDRIKALEI